MLISQRPCKIGSSVNTRAELHGDEDVPACDIPLEGITLSREELDALLGAGTHKALFAAPKKGAPPEPRFRQLKPFVLRDKYEDCTVSLALGINREEVTLDECKLARITLEPQVGGMTALSCQVQCAPTVETMATVIAHMNGEADVELALGKRVEPAARKQKDLGLGFAEGDGAAEDDAGDEEPEQNGAAADPADRPLAPHENLPPGVPPIHQLSDKSKH